MLSATLDPEPLLVLSSLCSQGKALTPPLPAEGAPPRLARSRATCLAMLNVRVPSPLLPKIWIQRTSWSAALGAQPWGGFR
mmetsp:Transcript_107772/g.310356  ORF Transcript_107772/g.310356 Transcript_107772/m.310356 type:complete len:81 (+) Transcript_107772:1001-1243(+)